MSTRTSRPPARVTLQLPLIVLVLAFTAIPVELQPLTDDRISGALEVYLDVLDALANILGYIPFGLVFASRGPWTTVAVSGGISLLAEMSQLISRSRSPGLIDVATNVLGAVIGLGIARKWKPELRIIPPAVAVRRSTAVIAATLALGYLGFGTRVTPLQIEEAIVRVSKTPRLLWLEESPRGSTSPGQLEAHWTFEDTAGEAVVDVSGNGLNGRLVNAPSIEDGIRGHSLRLNGLNQYVDLGRPTALQLAGSETISAWIRSTAFPVDDAAVVSNHSGLGYQLDTTVDRGPRTIGFKLADAQGRLMARYGRTPLSLNTWYHIAGVYDAQAQALTVYSEWREGQRLSGWRRDQSPARLRYEHTHRQARKRQRLRVRWFNRRRADLLSRTHAQRDPSRFQRRSGPAIDQRSHGGNERSSRHDVSIAGKSRRLEKHRSRRHPGAAGFCGDSRFLAGSLEARAVPRLLRRWILAVSNDGGHTARELQVVSSAADARGRRIDRVFNSAARHAFLAYGRDRGPAESVWPGSHQLG